MKINKYKLLNILIFLLFIVIISICIIFIYNINKRIKTNNINHYNNNITKVVEISSYDEIDNKSYGTGWFISDNIIVTNYHVLSFNSHDERILFDVIEIRFYDEEEYEEVSLIKYDEIKDIAFLEYNGNHEHTYFNQQLKYNTSDKIYTIGNFNNYGLSYKEGYISLKAVNLSYNNEYYNFIQCSIGIGQGDSGSPIFNNNNEIIGMITFRTKNINGNVEQCFAYCIPLYRILEIYNQ